VEYDLDFVARAYRTLRRRDFTRLREDFCGTAALACAWVRRGPDHLAWGVDRDREPLAWCRAKRLPWLRRGAERVTLENRDVRARRATKVDVVVAFNFSYWVFHERRDLVGYFRSVRRSLRPHGMLFVNAFGGAESMRTLTERSRIAAGNGPDGEPHPAFTYEWEQARFNPIDHRILCHIHFRLANGTRLRRAFTYDWRVWSVPEIRDAMRDAGFRASHVYVEDWDEERDRPGYAYRRRVRIPPQDCWLAYVAALA
jgi:SAM-dependent methyltransferase